MLRTNSKKAVQNIHKYICSRLADDMDIILDFKDDFPKVAKFIMETFEKEKPYSENNIKNLHLSEYTIFRDWASGLPMDSLFLYYYNISAIYLHGNILEETEEERSRFTEEQAEERLTMLIYREVKKYAE